MERRPRSEERRSDDSIPEALRSEPHVVTVVIFIPTSIDGVMIVELEPRGDDRGFFARSFCARTFASEGLTPVTVQTNVSVNRVAGTLRGLHYQHAPAAEAKLVRCTRGRVFDVALDVRPASPTYLQHVATILDADSRRALYVPEGFAHGFLTLEDDTELTYQVSAEYSPQAEDGVRWDDPAVAIPWPIEVRVISDKDEAWPLMGTKRAGAP